MQNTDADRRRSLQPPVEQVQPSLKRSLVLAHLDRQWASAANETSRIEAATDLLRVVVHAQSGNVKVYRIETGIGCNPDGIPPVKPRGSGQRAVEADQHDARSYPLSYRSDHYCSPPMNLCIVVRHAESAYNIAGRVNGDPGVQVPLSPRGVRQAEVLAAQLRNVPIDAVVHTRLERTAATARLALDRPGVLMVCEPLLDDIGCGLFEGSAVADDHAWRAARPRSARPPGGESIVDATQRIARGLRQVVQRREDVVLLVTHEITVRYLLNSAANSDDIAQPHRDVPNAVPFLFGAEAVDRAATRMEEAITGDWVAATAGEAANGG